MQSHGFASRLTLPSIERDNFLRSLADSFVFASIVLYGIILNSVKRKIEVIALKAIYLEFGWPLFRFQSLSSFSSMSKSVLLLLLLTECPWSGPIPFEFHYHGPTQYLFIKAVWNKYFILISRLIESDTPLHWCRFESDIGLIEE